MNSEMDDELRAQLAKTISAMPSHIVEAHKFCRNHKAEVLASAQCGCFYCLQVFPPHEIHEWVNKGDKALCPQCGIDSVLPEKAGVALTMDLLQEMKRYWFRG